MVALYSRSSDVKVFVVCDGLLFNVPSVTKGDRGTMETYYWVAVIFDAIVSTVLYVRIVYLPSGEIVQ